MDFLGICITLEISEEKGSPRKSVVNDDFG